MVKTEKMLNEEKVYELADQLMAARERKTALSNEEKALKETINGLDGELYDAMSEAEMENFNRNGMNFYLSSQLTASARDGQKDKMIRALRSHKHGELVIETVNAAALSSFCKKQMEKNKGVLPKWLEECVCAVEKATVGIKKA